MLEEVLWMLDWCWGSFQGGFYMDLILGLLYVEFLLFSFMKDSEFWRKMIFYRGTCLMITKVRNFEEI